MLVSNKNTQRYLRNPGRGVAHAGANLSYSSSDLEENENTTQSVIPVLFSLAESMKQNIANAEIEQKLQNLEARVQLQINDRPSILALMQEIPSTMPLLTNLLTNIESDYNDTLFCVSIDEFDPHQLAVEVRRDSYPDEFDDYIREHSRNLDNRPMDDEASIFLHTGFRYK